MSMQDYVIIFVAVVLGSAAYIIRGKFIILSRENRKLESIIEGTFVATWEWNIQTGVVVINERWAEIIGYNLEELLPVSINTWLNFAHPEDLKLSEYELKKVFDKQGIYYDFVCRMKHKDGRWVWVRGRGKVTEWSSDGKPITMIGTHYDITEIKQTEIMLKQTQENYETFFNTIDEFLFVLDEQSNIIHMNSTVLKRLEYTKEELMGKSVLMVHPHERHNEVIQIVEEMLSGKTKFCPIPIVAKSGFQIPVETRISRGFWDGKPVIFGVTKDISSLKLSEEKFSKIFHVNSSACGLSDLENHKYIEVNKGFCNLLAFNKDEVIGKTAYELGILTPETSGNILTKSNTDGSVYNVEAEIKAKNNDIKHVLLSAENIYIQDRKYRFTVVNDITKQKLAEREILFLSNHDQLTGLYNRRYFDNEVIRLNNEKYLPLTLVMVDVNGLKLTNDAFGHKLGDILLQKIANILKRACRTEDVISRIGGDEFVLLLPNTGLIEANTIIFYINEMVANEKIDSVILSISTGVAVKQDKSDSIEEVFKKAEDEMYKHKLSESSSMRSKTIDLIINTLYEKSNREMLHSKRVSELCVEIALKMGFDHNNINNLRIAGLMHDIGKIGIDEKILNKPQKLDDDEWNEIQRHSEIGYRILSSSNEFSEISKYVLEHHERWNGNGYPMGLCGEEISLQSRIIAVADAYDAMSSDRAYRKALSKDKAIEEIKRHSGTQFDPKVVEVFLNDAL